MKINILGNFFYSFRELFNTPEPHQKMLNLKMKGVLQISASVSMLFLL